jgi:hypothetical protein
MYPLSRWQSSPAIVAASRLLEAVVGRKRRSGSSGALTLTCSATWHDVKQRAISAQLAGAYVIGVMRSTSGAAAPCSTAWLVPALAVSASDAVPAQLHGGGPGGARCALAARAGPRR